MASVKIIGKVAVKVYPDTTDFKKDLESDLDRIERQIGDLKVNVVPQIDKSSKELLKAQMEKLRESLDGKNVNFDVGMDLNNGDIAATEAAIAAATRPRKVNVGVDYDRDSLEKVTQGILAFGGARPQIDGIREAFERLRNIDYVALSTAKVATQFTVLGAAALATTGHLLTLGSDILSIGQAGLALPGIFGGIVIGLGSTAAAFADFNTYVPQASEYMTQLQDTISGKFWATAAAPINEFINGVFPVLNSALADTGARLGEFFGSLAQSAGTSLNPALDGMFGGLNQSIAIATKSTGDIVNIIRILGETGAAYLPDLARWFNDITAQFSNFLSNAEGDTLNGWINEGITNLQALWTVLTSTWTTFSNLTEAARAAGGLQLTGLAASLQSIADITGSAGFKAGLTEVFKTAFTLMGNITDQAGPALKAILLQVADVFNAVGPKLGASIGAVIGALGTALSSPDVKSGALALFDGISNAIAAIAPAIGPIVSMLSSLGPVFAALLTNIVAISVQGIDKLAPTFKGLAAAAVPIIEKLGSLFTSVLDSLTPVFQTFGENITKVVQKLGPLIDAVQELWNKISPVLIPALKIVVTIIGDMLMGIITGVTMVFKGLIKVIDGVVSVFKGFGDVIAGIFTLDFDRVKEGFGQIFSGLGDVLMGALEVVAGAFWAWINGPVLGIFGKAGKAVLGFASKAFAKVGDTIMDVITYPFGALGSKIGGPISAAFDFIKGVFSTAFAGIKLVVETFVSVLTTIFRTTFEVLAIVFKTAWDVIAGVFRIAFEVIGGFLSAAWTGIVEFFRVSMEGLYFIFKGPWDEISAFLLGLWNNIKVGATMIWDSLRVWFETFLNGWIVRFEDTWTAISNGVTNAFNAVKNFFTGIWDSISSGVGSKVESLRDKLANVWEVISTKVSNVWGSIKSKIDEVWTNIKEGVSEKVTAVREKLSGVWDSIKSKVGEVWEGISSKIDGVWTGIKSSVETAVTTVKTKMDAAWTTIKTEVSTAWEAVKTTVTTKIGDVVGFVKELPGKALEALGNLSTYLKVSGAALIQGFIDGIQSKFESAKNIVKDGLSKLRNLFPFSPAKEGPFSGKGYTSYSGKALMSDFAKGMASQRKTAVSAAFGVLSAVSDVVDNSSSEFDFKVRAYLDSSELTASNIPALAASVNAAVGTPERGASNGDIRIDNISIPLEDLEQLKTLEDFMDMLRVRTRQGVFNA